MMLVRPHTRIVIRKVRRVVVVPLTWQDGWTWYHAMRSPGLLRSNEALAGWKAAHAEHVSRDVDYE
jgi:hypothetical protein